MIWESSAKHVENECLDFMIGEGDMAKGFVSGRLGVIPSGFVKGPQSSLGAAPCAPGYVLRKGACVKSSAYASEGIPGRTAGYMRGR